MRLLGPDSLEPPAVSVVIRSRNESGRIGLCLEALRSQDHPGPAEVVLVDSGSTDGTVEIARRYPLRIVQIEPASFTYSSALNLGFAAARASRVAALSAHAVPADGKWLRTLDAALDDSRVAGAYSREVPWPDADLYERLRLEALFPPYRMVKGLEFALEAGDRERFPLFYTFSNAAALLRRSLWEERPFRELPYAEDLDWARWALLKGHWIVYQPGARVRHSHREPVGLRAAREVKGQLALAEIFGHRESLVGGILRSLIGNLEFALQAARGPLSLSRKCYWSFYALRKWAAFAWRWTAARGGRRARCG